LYKVHPVIMRKLELIIDGREDQPITPYGQCPPCFESVAQFRSWIEASDPELGAAPPLRRDWPSEPNYCRDCTKEHRNEMRANGRCLFPRTRFIEVGSGEDAEVVGTDSFIV
jgi:hypothetical protein